MDDELQPVLRDFVADYCTRYKIIAVNAAELTLETSLDLDLDIVDIEIDLFLAEFAGHFNLDNTKFTWYKYGYPKGSVSVKLLRSVFGYRRRWVKHLSHHLYQPKYKISNLQQAVNSGKLI